jgi:hypothetical protein
MVSTPFIVTVVLLTVTALGWSIAAEMLEGLFQKQPVSWPQGVEIDPDHRNLSLATEFAGGRFHRAADGELSSETDGTPDGEILYEEEDTLNTLGVATSWDRTRYEDRQSNWYVHRFYLDERPEGPFKLWTLSVTYYTGGLDVVPHIPEVCLQAAGSSVQSSESVDFEIPAGTVDEDSWPAWQGKLAFREVPYYSRPRQQGLGQEPHVDYYIFCLNGEPTNSREEVRLKLTNPLTQYAYFAKIQFGPREAVYDKQAARQAAESFIRAALPAILEQLPKPETVEKLNTDSGE